MRWCFHLNIVFTAGLERKGNKKRTCKSSAKSRNSGRSSGTRSTSSSKSFTMERAMKEKLKMAELMAEASFVEKKHTSRYQTEKLELEEKIAKSKAKVKVFEEQPTTRFKKPFPPRKKASYRKTKKKTKKKPEKTPLSSQKFLVLILSTLER